MAKNKITNRTRMRNGGCNNNPGGPKTVWPRVKLRLAEVEELVGQFVSEREISKRLGISCATFQKFRRRYSELADAVRRGQHHRLELVKTGVYKAAIGEAVRVEEVETLDAGGKLHVSQRKTTHFEVMPQIGIAILKQSEGWADNPVVDNAVAKALREKKLKEFSYKILNIAPPPPVVGGASPLSHRGSDGSWSKSASSPQPSPRGEGDVPLAPQELQGSDPKSEILGPDASGDASGENISTIN